MPWKPDLNPRLLTESEQRSPILPAAEVQLLVDDLHAELTMEVETAEVRFQLARFDSLLESFVQDWRQLCAQHGLSGRARQDFARLAAAVHKPRQDVNAVNRISAARPWG